MEERKDAFNDKELLIFELYIKFMGGKLFQFYDEGGRGNFTYFNNERKKSLSSSILKRGRKNSNEQTGVERKLYKSKMVARAAIWQCCL